MLLSSKGWHPNRVVSFVNSLFICWIRVKKCPLTSRNWDSSHVTGGQILLLSYLKKLFCRTVWNFYLMWKWLLGFLCVFILRSYLTAFGILSQKPRLILELVFFSFAHEKSVKALFIIYLPFFLSSILHSKVNVK